MGKTSRLETWLHYRVRVTISDTRYFVGTFLSYDRHMNIVLVDAEEYRKVKDKETDFKEIKRVVGLIMIRGENIVSFTAEQAPIGRKAPDTILNKGIAAGRGVPLNNYVPMQPHMNPHLGNPLGNMPTGSGLHASVGKPIVPPAHAGFRPPNTFAGNINNVRPPVPGMPPIPHPPMNQRPPMGQPPLGQAPMNPAPMNPPPIGQPPVPNAANIPPVIPPHLPFPPNAKPPTE